MTGAVRRLMANSRISKVEKSRWGTLHHASSCTRARRPETTKRRAFWELQAHQATSSFGTEQEFDDMRLRHSIRQIVIFHDIIRVLVDDHLGVGKGLANQQFHIVGNFMSLAQGKISVHLHVHLDENIGAGGTGA